ncbi:MAG: hypothetical protein EXS69_00650 [Candidatus Zambryskibacteria bacterium]|nr:hypothetical protein [Candidatus Zambryskibacteria bacterium]
MAENKPLKKWELLTTFGLVLMVGLFISRSDIPIQKSLEKDVMSIKSQCQSLRNKETCYAKAFENLTKTTDWNHSFAVLYELQKIEPESRGCHFIAHSITIAETQKDPSRWREIMNAAPQGCSYGASHGALEVHASTFPDGKLPKSEIASVCNNPDTNNCTHILGHLLLIINENDIPESLKDCEKLPHNDFGKFECLTGVFMERITAFNLVEHGLATRESLNWVPRVPELEALCREQMGVHSIACWKEIVHVALIKFNNNPQKIVDFCETAPDEEGARECINHSLGIMAGSYSFELGKMKPICEARAAAPDFKSRCYVQLVGATLSTIPQEKSEAVKFCKSIDSVYQEACFKRIDNTLKFYTGN